jgi:hypothetical protein
MTMSNEVELSWTYSLSVNQFKFYRCSDANGPFTNLAGTSAKTMWTQPLSNPSSIYWIVAKKTLP